MSDPYAAHNITNMLASHISYLEFEVGCNFAEAFNNHTREMNSYNAGGGESFVDYRNYWDERNTNANDNTYCKTWVTKIIAKHADLNTSQLAAIDALASASIRDDYILAPTSNNISYTDYNGSRNWAQNQTWANDLQYNLSILCHSNHTHSMSYSIQNEQITAIGLAERFNFLVNTERTTHTDSVEPWESEEILKYTGLSITKINATSFKITGGIAASEFSLLNSINPRVIVGDQFTCSLDGHTAVYKINSFAYDTSGTPFETIVISTNEDGSVVSNALGTGWGADGATFTDVDITTSVLSIAGTTSGYSPGMNLIDVNTNVTSVIEVKQFLNTTSFTSSDENVSDDIVVETKDFDFELPGVKKNIYKVLVTIKGEGFFNLEYALNSTDLWSSMSNLKTGQSGQFEINSSDWSSLDFDFKGHTNDNPSTDNGDSLYAMQDIVDTVVRDVKSIRFRLVSSGSVSGFELNDMSLYYRIKGIV